MNRGQPLRVPPVPIAMLWQSARWDADLGLYLMRYRWYDPELGQFLSRDPLGLWGDAKNLGHGTLFAGNDPINFVDPYGLEGADCRSVWDWTSTELSNSGLGARSKEEALKRGQALAARPGVTGLDSLLQSLGNLAVAEPLVQNGVDNALLAGSLFVPGPEDVAIASVGALRAYRLANGAGVLVRQSEEAFQVVARNSVVASSQDEALELAKLLEKNWPEMAAGLRVSCMAAKDAAAKGGTYVLTDRTTGQVMRTGRSADVARREGQHARDPILGVLRFDTVNRTDSYPEQRGLEHLLNQKYDAPLDKINAISPYNPRKSEYLDAAEEHLKARSQ